MSHKASAYEQVRDLCNTLSNSGNVTDRRKASEQLRNLLGDVRFQTKLGRETGHDPLKIASVWRLAITNSLLAAQRLTEGRGKRTKIQTADMRLPGAILMLVDKDSGQYLPSIFGGDDVMSMHMGMHGGGGGSGSSGGAGMSGAASSSSSSSNQPTSLADPRCCTRLSSKEIQKLLEFCVNALGDEECREVAEPDLMNTLSTLCSRADYVAHFHAEKDVEFILSEIEERLLPTKGRVLGGVDASAATRMAIVENAAKTLAHLVYHLAVSLGYGMHKQLASCFDLIVETLRATNLGELVPGSDVNFERSARVGDEIGGHTVSGHVHAKATIVEQEDTENNRKVVFELDEKWSKYILPKGFVAVDGCSLTVGETSPGRFNVWLIPETIRQTVFAEKSVGSTVNIEIESQTQTIVDTIERVLAERGL